MLTDSTQPGFQERGIDWIEDYHLAVVQKHRDDAEEALSKENHEDAILALAQTASALLQLYDHRAYPSIMSDLHRKNLSSVSVQLISSIHVNLGLSARAVNRCLVLCIILLYVRMKKINLRKCMERGK